MNDITVRNGLLSKCERTKNGKLLTTREVAENLKTSPKVILTNAKKCLPNKVFEHGKPTYWSEEEVTVLLECLKNNNNNQSTFTAAVKDITTSMTPALMIKQAMELAQKGYELELERIKAENLQLEESNKQLEHAL